MKVLVIDDYITVRKALHFQLIARFKDIDVSEASTMAEALKHLENNKFDYIITDLKLPDSGIQNTIKVLERFEKDNNVIWMSASEVVKDGMIAKNGGSYFKEVMGRLK